MRRNARFGFGYPGATQSFTSSVASQSTTALNAQTTSVRIACNQAIRVEFGLPDGSAVTATATSMLIPAGFVEYFTTKGGEKIAILQDSAAGSVTITEMTA